MKRSLEIRFIATKRKITKLKKENNNLQPQIETLTIDFQNLIDDLNRSLVNLKEESTKELDN